MFTPGWGVERLYNPGHIARDTHAAMEAIAMMSSLGSRIHLVIDAGTLRWKIGISGEPHADELIDVARADPKVDGAACDLERAFEREMLYKILGEERLPKWWTGSCS